ncbi:hypothetical protein J3459_006125 [Metarhizium acridum]|uniref:uncharacterized protein n=1 Tax=Metarhizium acridum TaxID=92637 RepID=UPI001C6BB12E|nr:hypothetical protein J3458_005561 [Metarhizium acridum]KAG8428038.1 hypothetical protein J3459_006125 [Metarhizium acridum]
MFSLLRVPALHCVAWRSLLTLALLRSDCRDDQGHFSLGICEAAVARGLIKSAGSLNGVPPTRFACPLPSLSLCSLIEPARCQRIDAGHVARVYIRAGAAAIGKYSTVDILQNPLSLSTQELVRGCNSPMDSLVRSYQ